MKPAAMGWVREVRFSSACRLSWRREFGKQPLEAIAKPQHFPAKLIRGQGRTAQDGVEAGAVAAARENPDPRFHPRKDYSIFFGSTSLPVAAH